MKPSILTVLVGLIFLACATPLQHTGFLKHYEGLRAVEGKTGVYFEALEDLGQYEKVYINEVQVISNATQEDAQIYALKTTMATYATAAYRKTITKFADNYTLVDVGQEGTVVISIALSLVQLNDDGTFYSVPMNKQSFKDNAQIRLLVESRSEDAMSNKLLARSMRVVQTPVKSFQQFSDIQAALDSWLYDEL